MKASKALLYFLVAAGIAFNASSQETPTPGEQISPTIVLEGIVRSQQEWGPPGFGENPKVDQKIQIFVLELRSRKTAQELSLNPDGHPNRRFAKIQISCDDDAFPSCHRLLTESIGHHVIISGEVAYAINPTDYFPVVMTVRLIQKP